MSRQVEFTAAAKEYAAIKSELLAANKRRDQAQREATECAERLAKSLMLLGGFVGRVQSSRCAIIDDGVLTIEWREGMAPNIKTFDRSGSEAL